ncbi:hypothetical protein ACWD4G_41205 [Streptomyces sp. NPDC002643]
MVERRERMAVDGMMTRIGQVVMLHHAGDREEARERFLGLWAEIGEDGDPLHRCTLAHYMADTQDDPYDELAWDLRALSAAGELTDARAAEGSPSAEEHRDGLAARAFYPSLHLNLAADYAKLDRQEAARSHLGLARAAIGTLDDNGHNDGYGAAYDDGIRTALTRLAAQLDEDGPSEGTTPGPPRQRP